MHMALNARRWTRSDLDRLPDDGNRYEVIEGQLFVTPPPSVAHEEIVAALAGQLFPFVAAHDLGRLYFPRNVIVAGGSQAEPDLLVRAPATHPDWEKAPRPILVVEVLSESTRRRDLAQKRDFYLKLGIPEYWAVDRRERSVVQFSRGLTRVVTTILSWSPASGAALEIDVSALFGAALPVRKM
jgi:Uma2 family endonuclease